MSARQIIESEVKGDPKEVFKQTVSPSGPRCPECGRHHREEEACTFGRCHICGRDHDEAEHEEEE